MRFQENNFRHVKFDETETVKDQLEICTTNYRDLVVISIDLFL